MELALSSLQPCGKFFVGSGLRCAIVFEAIGGHQNSWRRKMRFNQFLVSRIPQLCYRSKHKLAEKLLEEANNYGSTRISDRSKLLDKISVMLGSSNLDDLGDNGSTQQQLVDLENQIDVFNVSLACKKYPCITLGSSPLVELYNDSAWHSQLKTYSETLSCEEFQPISTDGKLVVPESLTEMCTSVYPSLPTIQFSDTTDKDSLPSPVQPQSIGVEAEQLGSSVSEESSFRLLPKCDKLNELMLDKPISCIKGLTKRRSHQLEDCGFHTVRKLLHHFPRTYADLQNSDLGIEDGQYLIFIGRILSSRAVKASYSLSFLEVILRGEVNNLTKSEAKSDDIYSEGKKIIYIHLKKYFRGTRFTSHGFLRMLKNKHEEGDIVCVSGKVKSTSKADHYEMTEYSFDVIENEENSAPIKGRPYPIYPAKGGLKPQFLREIITRVLHSLPATVDPIPGDITRDIGLLHLHDAYVGIHQPKDLNQADVARRRFIFDEFFYLQLGRLYQMLEGLGSRIEKEGLLIKYRNMEQNAVFTEKWSDLTKKFFNGLPYSLTRSQLSAVSEIIWDLMQPAPMNRLLQGDVGCGKTVVAFLACMEVIGSGYQAAYMVPSELLAIQHYKHLSDLLENLESDCKPSIALLTGSTPTKQARMIRNELQTGNISLIIGTHSLIAETVKFSALRLAVIDEQHRFGVIQRGRFNSKLLFASMPSGIGAASSDDTPKDAAQMAPHVLAMSATPIPRSLALALYGDMSLTQITDLPPGRLPIETNVLVGNDKGFEKVYEMMLHELEEGGKVYLVYPLIEESELLPELRSASGDFKAICSRFPSYSCGLLHGKMKSDEKDEALKCFRDGETQILLATQVIEIGIDVPDASMMVVMNADRFGMAQLHQLRGRVGRGARKSKCILVGSTSSRMSRLKVLEQSSDGFHLAKADLLLRGPGDLLGKKQSGHLPEFSISRLEIDGSIIQDAHVAALKILSTSHNLEQYPLLKAELSMRQPLSLLGD